MSNIVMCDIGFDRLGLRDLVDIEKLQRIQDEFAADTGLAMITVDATGTPITSASQFSSFCRFLRQDPNIRKLCYRCDAHGGFQSAIEGKPFVYQCHAGLVDFSVAITLGQTYLGAILCGQVLLNRGQNQLGRILSAHEGWEDDDEVLRRFEQVNVVDISKLEAAADAIIKLANDTLSHSGTTFLMSATAGPYLGRLQTIRDAEEHKVLAPLLAGKSKPLPLVPIESGETPAKLDATPVAHNLQTRNLAANRELLSRYLDQLLPRWSQKVNRSELSEFEDLMIGIATSEGVHYGREIAQTVIRNRGQRRTPLNRYECQRYCEQLLIQLHNLIEPELTARDRSIPTLLNEIEKSPTGFLTVRKAATYMMWSDSHFSRQFKEYTGQSFINYVTAKRLERAKLMLAHTNKPVFRIASELEFHPLNYFSRAFKKHVGVTPTQYREQCLATADEQAQQVG